MICVATLTCQMKMGVQCTYIGCMGVRQWMDYEKEGGEESSTDLSHFVLLRYDEHAVMEMDQRNAGTHWDWDNWAWMDVKEWTRTEFASARFGPMLSNIQAASGWLKKHGSGDESELSNCPGVLLEERFGGDSCGNTDVVYAPVAPLATILTRDKSPHSSVTVQVNSVGTQTEVTVVPASKSKTEKGTTVEKEDQRDAAQEGEDEDEDGEDGEGEEEDAEEEDTVSEGEDEEEEEEEEEREEEEDEDEDNEESEEGDGGGKRTKMTVDTKMTVKDDEGGSHHHHHHHIVVEE